MVNKKFSRLCTVCEHDPIWLRFVVVQTGVRNAQVRPAREKDDTGVKEVKGWKVKSITHGYHYQQPPAGTRGASERGKRARISYREGKQRFPFPKLIQKLKLTYLIPVIVLSAFQHLHWVFLFRVWGQTNKKKAILSHVITRHLWHLGVNSHNLNVPKTHTHCHKLIRVRLPVFPPQYDAATGRRDACFIQTLGLTYGARRPPNTTKLGLNFFPDVDRRLNAPSDERRVTSESRGEGGGFTKEGGITERQERIKLQMREYGDRERDTHTRSDVNVG